MNNLNNHSRTLLAVLAHPDDETFGLGGTLAFYARLGVETHLVCATRGEVGEVAEGYMEGFNSIADRRVSELRCAAGVLGLKGVYFLNYRDSGMPGSSDNQHPRALAAQPVEKVAGEIVYHIRTLKPQVVVTFDPIGGYHHPDHIAIHHAAKQAFFAAGDPAQFPGDLQPFSPAKLYYQTIPRGFLKMVVRLLPLIGRDPHRWGKNRDIDLAAIANVNFPTHAIIDYRPVSRIRDQAAACHASQGGASLTGGITGVLRRLFSSREIFMRAWPEPVGDGIERDLFEGIG